MFSRAVGVITLFSLGLFQPALAQPSPDTTAAKKDHPAAVKESLQKSMAALRQYTWSETTVISVKGEEKSRTENSCLYAADGNVQKTPVTAAEPKEEEKKKGLRGKIVENKKEEMSDAAKEAVALVKQYVPPDPARIQAAKAEGRMTVTPPDAGGQVRLVIKDYLKAGDSLTLDVSAASDVLTGVTVATFTEKEKDVVVLKVGFAAFTDGTIYPAKIQLEVTKQNLAIAIDNSGYKKVGE